MARTRSTETRIRDARAVELRRRGLTYAQISAELGMAGPGKAHEAVRRGLLDAAREDTDTQTYLALERLDSLIRHYERIIAAKHPYVASNGTVPLHPETGQVLLDDGPILTALAGLRQTEESRRKLLGLDAPTRVRQEVIMPETVEQAIADLEAELARNDPEPASDTSAAG